jgi:hypothetical protein
MVAEKPGSDTEGAGVGRSLGSVYAIPGLVTGFPFLTRERRHLSDDLLTSVGIGFGSAAAAAINIFHKINAISAVASNPPKSQQINMFK